MNIIFSIIIILLLFLLVDQYILGKAIDNFDNDAIILDDHVQTSDVHSMSQDFPVGDHLMLLPEDDVIDDTYFSSEPQNNDLLFASNESINN